MSGGSVVNSVGSTIDTKNPKSQSLEILPSSGIPAVGFDRHYVMYRWWRCDESAAARQCVRGSMWRGSTVTNETTAPLYPARKVVMQILFLRSFLVFSVQSGVSAAEASEIGPTRHREHRLHHICPL